MMILYLSILFVLYIVRFLVAGRAARLEKNYVRLATASRNALNGPVFRQGNNNRPDPTAFAKKQYQLGRLVDKRDQAEASYLRWQARSDKLSRGITSLRQWKGRLLPYLAGIVDVALIGVSAATWYGVDLPTVHTVLRALKM